MVSHNVPSLVMWRDLIPYPERLVQPSASSPHVLIVGAGVTGLVTAWVLLDQGYKVTIISKDWANFSPNNRLTAQIAGALWEYPPAVCGAHTDRISLSNSKRWCMTAYHAWDAIASIPELSRASGVRMMPSDFFFPNPVENDPAQFSKMAEIISSGVKGFRQDTRLMEQRRVNPSYGAVDAYELLAPIIDTDQAMMWLMSLVHSKGASTVTETISGDLFDQEEILRARFGADAIVNATGLAGTELAGDPTCYPIRGALIRVINDGRDFPKVEAALTITADAVHDSNEIVFLVPRNDNILLIGGIAQPNESSLDLTLDSPIVKRMRQRCEAFLPGLKHARVDATYPLAQGLRPFRSRNVRVERELRCMPGTERPSRIVHSYGQGGAGWSLSFGCAGDVADLLKEALGDSVPTPMELDHSYSDGSYSDGCYSDVSDSHTTTSSHTSASSIISVDVKNEGD
ncbi:hypothetical protein SLS53_001748 [Cytospora paraplurivora]|uniref:FAD dependent oxidoreductase domain-containing protein n=1 Tax=Cytospora paraplurivora TaxID=2898453 RepID=A0AAN9UHC5_9PEZI